MNSYYYAEGGETLGPIAWDQLRFRVDNGLLAKTTQVCAEGTELWLTFESVCQAKRQQEKVNAVKSPAPVQTAVRVAAASSPTPILNPVTVIDIQMPFFSMVVFMVKWAFAAIPAAIILLSIYFLIGFFLAVVFRIIVR